MVALVSAASEGGGRGSEGEVDGVGWGEEGGGGWKG